MLCFIVRKNNNNFKDWKRKQESTGLSSLSRNSIPQSISLVVFQSYNAYHDWIVPI